MSKQNNRKYGLLIVILVFILAGIWAGWHWLVVGRYYQSTNDAYVSGNLVNVMSQVAGNVKAVYADETQHVLTGQTLVVLDDADARLALARAESALAQTVRTVAGQYQAAAAAQALVVQRQVELERARSDLSRRSGLHDARAISGEDLEHARLTVAAAQAALLAAQRNHDAARAVVLATPVAHHPAVLQAEAQVRQAWLDLQRTRIYAPVSGRVAKRSVQVGEHVTSSSPLLAVVPERQVWVDANFKEDRLAKVRIGQPVSMVTDLYGSDVVFHGHVAGLSAGTGNVFSLLPAQNATGNWIKVVQRLPVRIALDAKELDKHPLQLGLSVTATVDVHDQSSGPPVLANSGQPLYVTPVLVVDMQPVERDIQQILVRNLHP